jgi:N-formylglutamate amidohydrolase
MPTYRFTQGRVPVLISFPHVGTELPAGFAKRLTPAARALPDTDWHLPDLYDFVGELKCSTFEARYSRFVIDLNRPPDDTPLYTGVTTGLIPEGLFDGTPVYLPGEDPDEAERLERIERYWRPYHTRLEGELARMVEAHGVAILFDAHSIQGTVPRLFEGRLPDLNLGTNQGRSAAPDLEARVVAIAAEAGPYSHVLNGRFKGGHITRHYGDPARGIHAVQLELVQETYMLESPPYPFRPDRAAGIRPHLRRIVEALVDWARTRG